MKPDQTRTRGFTLVELMIVIAIMAVVASIGTNWYRTALTVARVTKATEELRVIGGAVDTYYLRNGLLPVSLADVEHWGRLDPWGNPYMYLNFQTGTGNAVDFVLSNGLIDPQLVEDWSKLPPSQRGGLPEPVTEGNDPVDVDEIKRKDQFLFPLNSDYDLFSLGPDRKAWTNITNEFSLDDVIRANNGAFFGSARDY